jgi:hypothetical protein
MGSRKIGPPAPDGAGPQRATCPALRHGQGHRGHVVELNSVSRRLERGKQGLASLTQPRPMYGIRVAIRVMNWTLASSGRFAMNTTASATCRTSMRGSTAIEPFA